MPIRDVSLFVKVVGRGYPLLLMHGGPGADHTSMLPFRRLADRFTLVFYDHRCNGRSMGAPLVDDLGEPDGRCRRAAPAAGLREVGRAGPLLRRPRGAGVRAALSRPPVAPGTARHRRRQPLGAGRTRSSSSPSAATAPRRWSWSGAGSTASSRRGSGGRSSCGSAVRTRTTPACGRSSARCSAAGGASKPRPEALIFSGRHLLPGWTVMDRLGEITVPTLVMAGRDDFVFPPECQRELAAGIPGASLRIVERAGHSPDLEQPAEVMEAVSDFLSAGVAVPAGEAPRRGGEGDADHRFARRSPGRPDPGVAS